MNLPGLHHITAIASDPARNVAFYTQELGLRLVKQTVNFDDPHTYHLYYGDDTGRPGTILTFFPWPDARRGIPGLGQVTAFAFQIPAGSLGFWRERLRSRNLVVGPDGERFGEAFLTVNDPDNFPVELIETAEPMTIAPPRHATVPAEHALRGFHSVTLCLEAQERTARILTDLMGARAETDEPPRFRYRLGTGPDAARIDLLCRPAGRPGKGGTGTVHHVAWRVADVAAQATARDELVQAGFNVSPQIDRHYFHSIYFREPGGVLFEIATDPPGFTTDETLEELGHRLQLPTWLEPMRRPIEDALPPLGRSDS